MGLEHIWLIWLLSSLTFIRFYIMMGRHLPKLIGKSKQSKFNTPEIIFQITTKGHMPIVQTTINQINATCRSINYSKYEIWVVSEKPDVFEGARLINVPGDFSCNAIFKGRALQYAVYLRNIEKRNQENTWIYHLDDESLITKQTLCNILTYLEGEPSQISEGLIIYPVGKEEKIKLTNLLDTLRPFCCFECMDFMEHGNPAYLHGSNLLTRSDIEEKIGWDTGKTIAEDTLFAITATRKLDSRAFGWHGGVIEEKSPYTLRDFMKQRVRWFCGLIQNMNYLNRKEKFAQSIRAFLWSIGFLSGVASILALFWQQNIDLSLRIFFIISSALWLLSYQTGAFLNGKYLSFKKRLQFHFLTLLFSPLLGIIESSIPIIALLKPTGTFEVIRK